ncbi:MAG: hypothetical protein ABWY05_04830 [Noviherbaspirillum sp.]
MKATTITPGSPYSRGPIPSASTRLCRPKRAAGAPQASTPLWKRTIVQIGAWLIRGPRTLGLMIRKAFTPPAASAVEQDQNEVLLLLQHIARSALQNVDLADKLLRNADIVGALACLPENVVVPLRWIEKIPEKARVRLLARIKLLAAAETSQRPGASEHAKKLHAFCVRIQQGLPHG